MQGWAYASPLTRHGTSVSTLTLALSFTIRGQVIGPRPQSGSTSWQRRYCISLSLALRSQSFHGRPMRRMGLPNKRLKLTGPTFRGSVRLFAYELVPQGGALAPAGARPAA